jgi:hypothetical protein
MGRIRGRAAAGLAAGVLASAAIVAITSQPAAHAATTQCGNHCEDLYDQQEGIDDFIALDSGTVQAGLGTQMLAAGRVSDEDFETINEGTVATFYAYGLVTAAVDAQFGSDTTYQFQYAPDGQGSDLCLGLASNATAGEAVTLQPCGEYVTTVWIDAAADETDGYVPLVNASESGSTPPLVLDADLIIRQYPFSIVTDLIVNTLTTSNGAYASWQLWRGQAGPQGVLP